MSLSSLFAGFAVNLLVVFVIVRFIYYPANPNKNYVFTYLAFTAIIYFVMSFLASVELGVGVGFGLFAIFSVLRYRTSTMSTREMTYLFIVIALPVMNSVMLQSGLRSGVLDGEWVAMAAVNAAVAAVLFALEREWGFHYESSQSIRYDRIDLITPERRGEMLEDLQTRTGLPVKRVEIGRLNLLNDTAELRVFYDEPRSPRGRRRADARVDDEVFLLADSAD